MHWLVKFIKITDETPAVCDSNRQVQFNRSYSHAAKLCLFACHQKLKLNPFQLRRLACLRSHVSHAYCNFESKKRSGLLYLSGNQITRAADHYSKNFRSWTRDFSVKPYTALNELVNGLQRERSSVSKSYQFCFLTNGHNSQFTNYSHLRLATVPFFATIMFNERPKVLIYS